MKEHINVERYLRMAFVIFAFCLFFMWSMTLPVNEGPDEIMKYDICKYIVKHGTLPSGNDPEVLNKVWGISYGFTPILSYIVSAVFVKVMSFFTQDILYHYIAARFSSVLFCTIMVGFVIKIADKLFRDKWVKWSFIIAVTMLPQVAFIGSYINNDALALLSISIIVYAWLIGKESRWNIKSCCCLAVGIGLCALSYYNAYSFILTSIIYFIGYFMINKQQNGKFDYSNFLIKASLISIISILLAGWWFIRSAMLYDGDFLGLKTTDWYAQKYAIDRLKPSNLPTPQNLGQSLMDMFFGRNWLRVTVKSFIGVFGGMNINMPGIFYIIYYEIGVIGLIGFAGKKVQEFKSKQFGKEKNKLLFEIILFLNIIIPFALSAYYSYASDFQPQGRYIMPGLIPIMYFLMVGMNWMIQQFFKEKVHKLLYLLCLIGAAISPITCLVRVFRFYM